jgi:hypothetical protein
MLMYHTLEKLLQPTPEDATLTLMSMVSYLQYSSATLFHQPAVIQSVKKYHPYIGTQK